MARPRYFYRGENGYAWIITLVASALVALILIGVWLFYDMQQYIVYDKDGVRVVRPSGQGTAELSGGTDQEAGERPFTPVDVELVVDKADYSDFAGTDGSGLNALHARYVGAESVTDTILGAYAANMGPYNALVLQLKGPSGLLSYHSQVALTDSYDVNGTAELAERVAKLRENGAYLVAELSALADGTMAVRNTPAAMRNAGSGKVYLNNGQAFLDPYSGVTREYLSALMEELADLGFDEVLLTGLWLPEDAQLAYSAQMTATPDAADAVSSLAVYLRGRADALGLRLSVEWAGQTSQDAALFFRAFDRVVYPWGDAEAYAALSAIPGADAAGRLVASALAVAPQSESYIVR